MNRLSLIPLELFFWITALTLLALAKPIDYHDGYHFTYCPLANMGFHWCPGCGLGRSITQLFHGNMRESLRFHWLGVPAVLIIGSRIVTLGKYGWKRVNN